ncbi:fatty acid synthase-like isoform X2 [Amblyomma americanum]
MAQEDIVISGFSGRFPQADHLAEFKQKVYAGIDMVTEDDTRWPPGLYGLPKRHGKIRDLSRFDALFFKTHPKQAHAMDPQLRLLMETSYEAIVDAGYDPAAFGGRNVGVFVGAYMCDAANAFREAAFTSTDGYAFLGNIKAMFANRISYALDFQGPSLTVDTACSSTMTALNEAVLALRSGRCQAAIVGSSHLTLDPAMALPLLRMGLLSEAGRCASFDKECTGVARTETVGAFFLQRASDARRVYAKVVNVGINADGFKAEGIASVAKVILMMETRAIPPNLHFKEPNPDIPSLHDGSIEVVDKVTPFNGGLVGINSKGFSGANAHAVLEANPSPSVDTLPREKIEIPRLVLMAGRTKDSLTNTLNRMESEGPYPDSAYALLNRVGQPSVKQFPYRGYALVSMEEGSAKDVKVIEQAPSVKRPLWFVFTGLGSQWRGMAREMMQFDLFARSIHKSHDVLEPFGVDLIDLVTNEKAQHETMASPFVSITAIQVALVAVLRAIGIQPDGIIGHSIGEAGCAYADGGLTAEQAVLCSYWQGRCTELGSLPKGAMAAVGLTWEEGTKRCPPHVYPACHNAEDSVTVAGPAEAVAKMVAELKSENIFVREVDTMSAAFHCRHVHTIGPALLDVLRKAIPDPKPRSQRWISSSVPQCRWNEPAAQLCSAEYQVNNYLSPVLFREALEHVPENAIVVEIAPHCLLQPILRRALGAGASCLGLMKRNANNLEFFLGSLGKLHTLGVQMDLSALYPPVPWPVPRGTPSIAHLVSWDHSESWAVPGWKDFPMPVQRHPVVAGCVKLGRSSQPEETTIIPSAMKQQSDGRRKRNVIQSVAHIIGVKDPSSLDPRTSLGELGVDSMMNADVKMIMERDFDLELSMLDIRDLTLCQLRDFAEGGTSSLTRQEKPATL